MAGCPRNREWVARVPRLGPGEPLCRSHPVMPQAPGPALPDPFPNLLPPGAPSAQARVVQVPERALPLRWSRHTGPVG